MTRNWLARRNARLHLEHLEDRSVPSTFTVNTTLDDVTPANGKFSLREAITKANTTAGADTIVLPAGVFKITISGAGENGNATGDFDITDAVAIKGAGAGVSIVDGQHLDRVFDAFGTVPSSFKALFQGLTIRDGNMTGVTGHGGGIRVGNADLVVRDCAVTGNRVSLSGGGISNGSMPGTGNVTLVRATVARNVAGDHGGGVSVSTSGSDALALSHCTVWRNSTASFGGGIFAAGTTKATNSTISGNSAALGGGGMYDDGTGTWTNCSINGNSAGTVGGGLQTAGTATLINSTLSGNSAGAEGGGIRAFSASLTDCTVSGNNAGTEGGGIWAITATLLNSTVVENLAHSAGGLFHDPGGTFSVKNTIVALNLVDFTGAGPDVSGAFTSQGHNLIGDTSGGTGFTNGVNGNIVGTAPTRSTPSSAP